MEYFWFFIAFTRCVIRCSAISCTSDVSWPMKGSVLKVGEEIFVCMGVNK